MDTREIAKQQQACLKSLHLLYKESQQTLALLSLVVQSPSDAEPRNRLEPQIDKEDRARVDYQHRRRELLVLVPLL